MEARRYEKTNPWITFTYHAEVSRLWLALGEAFSKCQHLSGTPLKPKTAEELASIYLVKGALASTAIEGNTLSEEEADAVINHGRQLPQSQQYLAQEIENVVKAISEIYNDVITSRTPFTLTTQWIRDQNRTVLNRLETEPHVVPGEYTTSQLVVGTYRAAPPEDVPYLMDRLATWINEWLAPISDPGMSPAMRFSQSFYAATLSHLYLAWIHPFGDGNGRTARLLECAILAHSGCVPVVSANLLSDYYNRTRTRYYQRLEAASKRDEIDGFLLYAAQGYTDMLREQINEVQAMQRRISWESLIYEVLNTDPPGATRERRREVALRMPEETPVTRRQIAELTPALARMYATVGTKTMSRDLNALQDHELIRAIGRHHFISNIAWMDAFKPPVFMTEDSNTDS